MPRGIFPRLPKQTTISEVLRENQELKTHLQLLRHQVVEKELRIGQMMVQIANLKLLILEEAQNGNKPQQSEDRFRKRIPLA